MLKHMWYFLWHPHIISWRVIFTFIIQEVCLQPQVSCKYTCKLYASLHLLSVQGYHQSYKSSQYRHRTTANHLHSHESIQYSAHRLLNDLYGSQHQLIRNCLHLGPDHGLCTSFSHALWSSNFLLQLLQELRQAEVFPSSLLHLSFQHQPPVLSFFPTPVCPPKLLHLLKHEFSLPIFVHD